MKIIKKIWSDWSERNGEMKILSWGYLAFLVTMSICQYIFWFKIV
jgi:hypothetical protein